MKILGDYNHLSIRVDYSLEGNSIRDILRIHAGISRRLITRSKKTDKIYLNNKPSKINKIAYENDIIKLYMDEETNIEKEKGTLDIVYEDIDLLVINKEPNILVHPTKNHEKSTLLNRVVFYANTKGQVYKPHLVNRLDRDTSGLLIIAKNPYTHYELMKQMQENKLEKKYLAICKGGFIKDYGVINYKISNQKHDGINRLITEDGRDSKTLYKVLKDDGELALVELNLLTGRTHQIRVHLNEIGHPILGDRLYGLFGTDKISRQALHSYSIKFKSPRTGDKQLSIPLRDDLLAINPRLFSI